MTQRNRRTGRYTDTRFDKVCQCGHTLGLHTAERVGTQQECLADDCPCESFIQLTKTHSTPPAHLKK